MKSSIINTSERLPEEHYLFIGSLRRVERVVVIMGSLIESSGNVDNMPCFTKKEGGVS